MNYEVIRQKLDIITMVVCIVCGLIVLTVGVGFAAEGQSDEELAKKLANPIAALISVPFEFNYNKGFGTEDGEQLWSAIQ